MNMIDPKTTPKVIGDIESELGIGPGFFLSLVTESDWSFVIKLHALIEAAFTFLISQTISISIRDFTSDELDLTFLSRMLAWMDLSGKRVGKLALSKSLGLVFEHQVRFVSRLSELRNELVHDVRNVSFNFETYTSRLDANQKKVLIEAFGFSVGSTDSIKALLKIDLSREDFVLKQTKFAIWLCSLVCLSEIDNCVKAFKSHEKILELVSQKAGMLDQLMQALEPAVKSNLHAQAAAANTQNNDARK